MRLITRCITTAALTITAAMSTAGPANATTNRLAMPVPIGPGIYNVSFEFTGTSARPPLLGAARSQLTGLPPDVTLLTGVRRVGATRRWRGIATMIRFRTGDAPAAGATRVVHLNSRMPIRVRVEGRATDTSQATEPTAGGQWITRVGRRAQHPEVLELGLAPHQLLTYTGNVLAGLGSPDLFYTITRAIPPDWYKVDVYGGPGDGTGVVRSSAGQIECTTMRGVPSGRCTAWYYARTPNVLTAEPSFNPLSNFTDWGIDCAAAGANPICDLGSPEGGRLIEVDAGFVRVQIPD